MVALLGVALDPTAFSEVSVDKGVKSLDHPLTKPVRYAEAPELFCLGIYPEFDLERLIPLAESVQMEQHFGLERGHSVPVFADAEQVAGRGIERTTKRM